MLRSPIAAALAAVAIAAAVLPAEARSRRQAVACDNFDVMLPCQPGFLERPAGFADRRRPARPARALKRGGRYLASPAGRASGRASYAAGRPGAGLVAGLVGPLAAKVSEIQAACGARLISGVRHTRIAGTRLISLHASGRAADLAGPPSCIYAQLAGWPGGYSVDYARVRHVHISYAPGGREWGARFHHGGGQARRHRMVRR